MLDSEREEYVRRTRERATLDRYIPRRFTTASESGELPLEEYRFRGASRERAAIPSIPPIARPTELDQQP
jgi:hypothetical protein